MYADVLLFGELMNISSYFIAWKFRGDGPCCRISRNFKKKAEKNLSAKSRTERFRRVHMRKEEDNKNGHTDAACNKGK